MSSKSFKVNSKAAKEVVILTTVLAFELLLIKTLIKDEDDSSLRKHSDF